jgi:hypothetical protein
MYSVFRLKLVGRWKFEINVIILKLSEYTRTHVRIYRTISTSLSRKRIENISNICVYNVCEYMSIFSERVVSTALNIFNTDLLINVLLTNYNDIIIVGAFISMKGVVKS